jgi:hypothetical protein
MPRGLRAKKRKLSRAYRTYLFKKRMLGIICLLLRDNPTECYFCHKKFTEADFPLMGRDNVDVHHVTYDPEYKVLAHHKCHLKHHREERRRSKVQKS